MMRKIMYIVLFLLVVSAVVAYELIINVDVSTEAYDDFTAKALAEEKTAEQKTGELLSDYMEASYLDTLDKELYTLKKELEAQYKIAEKSRDATEIQKAIDCMSSIK